MKNNSKSDKFKTSLRAGEVGTKCRVRGIINKQAVCSCVFPPHLSTSFVAGVMDTRLPQPAGCGDKYDVSSYVQCGRSMIEMLGVLAIIAVLSVGGIAVYSKAMEQFKINKSIDYITQIVSNVQTLYMQQKSYNGLSNNSAMNAGIYPENNMQLPLGRNTSVWVAASEDGLLFGLRICGLTYSQCRFLTSHNWGTNANGLYGVSIVLAHNFFNGAAGVKQSGQSCSGTDENSGAYFACADNGENVISFDIAQKYCYSGSSKGTSTVCMGLFFR